MIFLATESSIQKDGDMKPAPIEQVLGFQGTLDFSDAETDPHGSEMFRTLVHFMKHVRDSETRTTHDQEQCMATYDGAEYIIVLSKKNVRETANSRYVPHDMIITELRRLAVREELQPNLILGNNGFIRIVFSLAGWQYRFQIIKVVEEQPMPPREGKPERSARIRTERAARADKR